MAAAFAVLFGAPIGSAFFALEILHRRGMQYHEALVPAIIGALSGYACSIVLTGAGVKPVWTIPPVASLRAVDFLWAIGAGVGGALVAVVFTYLVLGLRRVFRLVPPRASARSSAASRSRCSRCGRRTRSPSASADRLRAPAPARASSVLVVAVVAKLLGTSVTVSSGWPGGFIIPLFFMGATLGQLTHHGSRDAQRRDRRAPRSWSPTNVGVTKTLLGSTLVVTEMGGMRLLPTTLLAALVAMMLTSSVGLIESPARTHADGTANRLSATRAVG